MSVAGSGWDDTGVGRERDRVPPPSGHGERNRGNLVQADLCSLITVGKVPRAWELGAHRPFKGADQSGQKVRQKQR